MKVLYTMLTMMIMTNTVFILTMMMSKKKKMSREKNTPFEGGFSNLSSARKPFSIHFFLVATLFLIFDIEISIILPMYNSKMTNKNEWILSSSITMMILIVGLLHEWNNGMLEWSK
uniref:NADH-ubiquinone oxidoreductase chain 3 n=1 Tax=Geisha distinctissima TaxID=130583 RepID=C3TX58_9HEMI|nr:NADH dehydrogenase subunit 3 [Geisha distinctissima]ACI28657.1 NADH dehydrogenase subunit 3 [Geisha distinctissima]